MTSALDQTSTSNNAIPTIGQPIKFIGGKVLNAAFGAGYGFLATKFLTIGGIVVASPVAGAVFGAASYCGPSLFLGSGRSEPVAILISKLAIQYFINLACGLVGAYLFGYQFTFANAAILTGTMLGGVILVAVTLAAMHLNSRQAEPNL